MQAEWPFNYVEALQEILDSYKYILIPSDVLVLSFLRQADLSYQLCYPERGLKEEYQKRFIARGNSETFLEVFIDSWDRLLGACERDNFGKHIVLGTNQFLADVYK